jgi:PAS domain S-box-containing protein
MPPIAGSRVVADRGAEVRIRALDEEALRLKEPAMAAAQFDAILNGMPQGVLIHRGGRPLYVNHALVRLLGYSSREAMLALPNTLAFAHPDDQAFIAGQVEARIAGREFLSHFEARVCHADGMPIWVDCHASCMLWGGQPASLTTMTDISMRKRIENSQRRTEKLFGIVFQASPDLVSLTTLSDGRYIDVNEAFLRSWGWQRSQIIGRTSAEIGFWKDATFRERMAAGLRRDGFVRGLDAKVRWPDGQVRDYSYSVDVIRFEDEDLLLGIGRDVTDARKTAENLRKSMESALIANRAKSEFLANMSHELRTPLNAILGFSEIIGNQIFGTGAQSRYIDYAKDIYASGRLLLQIIDDLLDISRLEHGKLELRAEEVSAAEIISTCLRLIEGRVRDARVKLGIDLPDRPLTLHADATRLKQVLLNLLSNAVKFTPEGGHITIGARPASEDGVAFFVVDTGIGMSESELAIAMQSFGQVANALTRDQQGTGLGLPLAKGLVELHGGTLVVESRPGLGTRVTATLPQTPKLVPLPAATPTARLRRKGRAKARGA